MSDRHALRFQRARSNGSEYDARRNTRAQSTMLWIRIRANMSNRHALRSAGRGI